MVSFRKLLYRERRKKKRGKWSLVNTCLFEHNSVFSALEANINNNWCLHLMKSLSGSSMPLRKSPLVVPVIFLLPWEVRVKSCWTTQLEGSCWRTLEQSGLLLTQEPESMLYSGGCVLSLNWNALIGDLQCTHIHILRKYVPRVSAFCIYSFLYSDYKLLYKVLYSWPLPQLVSIVVLWTVKVGPVARPVRCVWLIWIHGNLSC